MSLSLAHSSMELKLPKFGKKDEEEQEVKTPEVEAKPKGMATIVEMDEPVDLFDSHNEEV